MLKTTLLAATLALATGAAQAQAYCEWVTVYDYYGNWLTVWQCY